MKLPRISTVTGIFGVIDPDSRRYSEIVITTSGRKVRLRCDPDTDEIVIARARKARESSLVPIVVGRFRVEWMWEMTNQQGYSDGFRIQLATKYTKRVIEFVGGASCIDGYEAHQFVLSTHT